MRHGFVHHGIEGLAQCAAQFSPGTHTLGVLGMRSQMLFDLGDR
jgi:hypothetical protein